MSPGAIGCRLERYLALRRALGFAMQAEERLLRRFVAGLTTAGAGSLRAHQALDWTCAPGCGPARQARRLSVARGFLACLHAIDPTVEVPGSGILARAVRPLPHLFATAEIAALLRAARALGPHGSLRPHTVSTLIGLLASTGLRAGEALRLRQADVALTAHPPRLFVRETKFRKSRIVPLHPSTAAALRAYAAHPLRRAGACPDDPFFVSARGTPLNYQVTARTFVTLARHLGLRGPVGERGPSLHALRHPFAVRRLLAWMRAGADVHARLPELAVYLGHVCPEDTYWYLTATPAVLRSAAHRLDTYLSTGGAS